MLNLSKRRLNRNMTVKELNKKLEKYIKDGYGDCELKTSDQGGNDGEVLGTYSYNTPEYSEVVIEIA